MSMRAIVLAVRDHLRKELVLTELECAATDDGMPHPAAGERFVAVYQGSRVGRYCEGRDEMFGVMVTVTVRTAFAPGDRMDSPLYGPDGEDLEKLVDAIAAKLHMDPPAAGSTTHYPVLAIANATIGTAANGFVEPLQLVSVGKAEPKGADWFSADPDSEQCGLAQTLVFDGARRLQTIESQT